MDFGNRRGQFSISPSSMDMFRGGNMNTGMGGHRSRGMDFGDSSRLGHSDVGSGFDGAGMFGGQMDSYDSTLSRDMEPRRFGMDPMMHKPLLEPSDVDRFRARRVLEAHSFRGRGDRPEFSSARRSSPPRRFNRSNQAPRDHVSTRIGSAEAYDPSEPTVDGDMPIVQDYAQDARSFIDRKNERMMNKHDDEPRAKKQKTGVRVCDTCNKEFFGSYFHHNKTQDHVKIHQLVKQGCRWCGVVRFKNWDDRQEHRSSEKHMEKQSEHDKLRKRSYGENFYGRRPRFSGSERPLRSHRHHERSSPSGSGFPTLVTVDEVNDSDEELGSRKEEEGTVDEKEAGSELPEDEVEDAAGEQEASGSMGDETGDEADPNAATQEDEQASGKGPGSEASSQRESEPTAEQSGQPEQLTEWAADPPLDAEPKPATESASTSGAGRQEEEEVKSEPDAESRDEMERSQMQLPDSYDPNVAVGVSFIKQVSGFFCKICRKFYTNHDLAIQNHCKSAGHYEKCKAHFDRLEQRTSAADAPDPEVDHSMNVKQDVEETKSEEPSPGRSPGRGRGYARRSRGRGRAGRR